MRANDVDLDTLNTIKTRPDFGAALRRLIPEGMTLRAIADDLMKRDIVNGRTKTAIDNWLKGISVPKSQALDVILDTYHVTDPELRTAWKNARQRASRWNPVPCPFPGFTSFAEADAELFMGRAKLTQELVTRITGLRAAGGGLIPVVGPSGSGKSSLLHAGLIPALGPSWTVTSHTPSEQLVAELARLPRAAGGKAYENLLLIIDQFEDVYATGIADPNRATLINRLSDMARDGAVIALGVRSDFLPHLFWPDAMLPLLNGPLFGMVPMNRDELREAIVEPARKAGRRIQPELITMLLDELAHPTNTEAGHEDGTLPLLSHALRMAWNRNPSPGEVTVTDYLAAGGLAGAVKDAADQAYDQLNADQQAVIRDLFLRMVHVTSEGPVVRRRLLLNEVPSYPGVTPDELKDALEEFVDQRFVTRDDKGMQISHDALIREWPRLRAWIDSDRIGLIIAQDLGVATQKWAQHDHASDALYQGVVLRGALEWAEARGHALTPLEREFLRASSRKERSRRRVLRSAVGLLTTLSIVATSAGWFAFRERNEAIAQGAQASHKGALAESQLMATRAGALYGTDLALAAQFSLVSRQIADTEAARSRVLDASAAPAVTRMVGPDGLTHAVALGRGLVAAGGEDGKIWLWDLAQPGRPVLIGTPIDNGTPNVTTLAFDPAKRYLASGSGDGTVRLWDLQDPAHPVAAGTAQTGSPVNSVAFGPRLLAAAGSDGQVRLWPRDRLDRPMTLRRPASGMPADATRVALNSVRFSPDGHTVAAVGEDGLVWRWDISGDQPAQVGSALGGPGTALWSVAFSKDGRMLAVGGTDDKIWLWDLTGPTPAPRREPLTGPTSWVYSVSFTPDGRGLIAGSADTHVYMWDLATRRIVAELPHPDVVTSVAQEVNGRLASGGADGVVRLWSLPGPVLTGSSPIFTLAFNPSGDSLAAASGDTNVRLWRTAKPGEPIRLWDPATAGSPAQGPAAQGPPLSDPHLVGTLAYSSTGWLAAGRDDGTVALWNANHPGDPVVPASDLTGIIDAVAFNAEGTVLAAGSRKGGVQLWDARDPANIRLLGKLEAPAGVMSLAFTPDGRTLAAASHQSILVWDVRDPAKPGAIAVVPSNSKYTFNHVAFSDDGRVMAAPLNHWVRLWDVTDPGSPRQFGKDLSIGPKGQVQAVAFGPDRLLAGAASDGTVPVWQVPAGGAPSTIAVLSGPSGTVFSVAFAPRGRALAAAGMDGTVRLYNLDFDAVTAYICAISGDPITVREWQEYVSDPSSPDAPGLAYNPPCGLGG
ncbi:WD40 repeat domain-containing protein [Acrocarpospora pleiomorpha]|nr:WD40 repeat domain-containing protein [Acrocarpospora pleiomorpha]